ncbi:hypothetical protein ACFVTX_18105 [Agromyces sp. NPDC058136]|uniref:hypothetical protein n=1 Tax=Agromyces sp. NPDC058136 TaxID=3346354 RepID=UPI0036DAB9E6
MNQITIDETVASHKEIQSLAAATAQHQLDFARALFGMARAGATVRELALTYQESMLCTWREAMDAATMIHELHARNEARAAETYATLAGVLAEYPENGWLAPVIVNAAPFPSRPAVWTRAEDHA